VVVDDLFPCDGNRKFLFSQGANNQLWVSILEKAYAKMYHSYAALDGGSVTRSLTDLTGAPCEIFEFASDKFDSDLTYATLMSSLKERFLVGVSCISKEESQVFTRVGLVRNHVYSLLGVEFVRGYRLLLLRNPWGHQEWNGEWSRKSTEWKGNEASIFYKDLAPGSFWISYEDLLKYFHNIVICKLYRDYEEIRYKDSFVKGQTLSWYKMTVLDTTDLHITFTQSSGKVQDNNSICLSWILVNYTKGTNMLISPGTNSVNSQNFLLEKGEYLIIPLTFSTITKDYIIALHSSKPILVNPAPVVKQEFQFHLQQSIVDNYCNTTTAQCHVVRKDLFDRISIYEWSSGYFHLFMVENLHPHRTIFFQCDASDSSGLISSRNTLLSHDVIFPKQRQIVLTLYSDPEIRAYQLSARYHCKAITDMPQYLHFPEISDTEFLYLPTGIKK
jgi:hypothetical protein